MVGAVVPCIVGMVAAGVGDMFEQAVGSVVPVMVVCCWGGYCGCGGCGSCEVAAVAEVPCFAGIMAAAVVPVGQMEGVGEGGKQ